MINFIIFSKDRAMQLDLLLRSIGRSMGYENSDYWIQVLYTFSDENFKASYAFLKDRGVIQINFKRDLLYVLDQIEEEQVCFLVDDCVFINPLERIEHMDSDTLSLSLRLTGEKWYWVNNEKLDYNYPMSLDGNIYRKSDIINILESEDYENPNQLEDVLHRHREDFKYDKGYMQGVLGEEPIVVNIPDNLVQSTHPKELGYQYNGGNAKELNDKFLEGYRIDLDEIIQSKDKTFPFWNHKYILKKSNV